MAHAVPPPSPLLRDWRKDSKGDLHQQPSSLLSSSEQSQPVVATLVGRSLPRINRKCGVLFQNTIGQRLHSFASNSRDESDYELEVQPSFSSWLFDDDPDEAELQVVNGELIEVEPVNDHDDDEYEEAYLNRRQGMGMLRKTRSYDAITGSNRLKRLIGRGKKKDKSKGKTKGLRSRTGSRDGKRIPNLNGKGSKETNASFPVRFKDDIHVIKGPPRSKKKNKKVAPKYSIPLATPCVTTVRDVRDNYYMRDKPEHSMSAPVKQNMSRAAREFMEDAVHEPKIVQDSEISDLGTDTDQDPISSFHSPSTQATSQNSSWRTPPPDDTISSSPSNDSWNSFIEKTKSQLEGDVSDTNTDVVSNERTSQFRTKSLPNIYKNQSHPPSASISTPVRKLAAKNRNKDHQHNMKQEEYQSRIEHVNRLSSELQSPCTPRRLRRRESDDSNGVSSPPQYLFERFVDKSPRRRTRKRMSTRYPRPQIIPPEDKYNDTLKVVFVGSPDVGKSSLLNVLSQKNVKNIRKNNKKTVHVNQEEWKPPVGEGQKQPVFSLWDLRGGSLNTGAHHSTQSIFFSPNSLYILVWDMSVKNSHSRDRLPSDDSGSDYDSDYEEALRSEEMNKLLERDIDEHVIYWIDLLSKNSLSGCAIMPVVTFTDMFDTDEVDRRCNLLMQRLLKIEMDRRGDTSLPRLVFDFQREIPRLSSKEKGGTAALERCLVDIANGRDSPHRTFQGHFQSKLCAVTTSVQQIISTFKEEGCEVVRLEQVLVKLAENPPPVENLSRSLVLNALKFMSSIGSIIYFGASSTSCTRPRYLEDFIILNPKWLSNALSLTLREDSISNFFEARKDQRSNENEVLKLNHSLPAFSLDETIQLWDREYVRKVGKNFAENGSNSDFFNFLQQVCEHSGIFVPFSVRMKNGNNQTHYLLPIFTPQVPTNFWSFKVKENWKTTLCNTFIFYESIPCNFIDKLSAEIVKDLFEVSLQDETNSLRIQSIIYMKTAIYAKIVEEVEDANKRYSHVTEIFVHLIENDSPQCVGSNVPSGGRKLIASAKGCEGNGGEKIWKLGYSTVLDSIEHVANMHIQGSVGREVVCPGCLLKNNPNRATVWNNDDVNYGDECIMCPSGHEASPHLLLGPYEDVDDNLSVATGVNSVYSAYSAISGYSTYTNASKADALLPGVVIVALWDRANNRVVRIGSGFIADNKRGLIVTASHTLFNLDSDPNHGSIDEEFFGLSNATAIIGVNPRGSESAVFTYCADIVASDVLNVDGCILQIKTKFERPVELDRNHLTERAEFPISSQIKNERLKRLRMTTEFQREQEVRVIGFRQTGEGILVGGGHINRIACVNIGYVCRPLDSTSHQAGNKFVPRSEIVVACSTGGGNSGGPFVNEVGEVIGILSRADPIETQRCYLTPASELKTLLKEARNKCEDIFYNSYSAMEHF